MKIYQYIHNIEDISIIYKYYFQMEEFPIEVMQNVFVTDSKLSSHPIVDNVQNTADIASFFDDVSYQKVCESNTLI